MTKRAEQPTRLASVPKGAPTPARVTTERIELPTGGRGDVDGLLRELARVAFPKALLGFSAEIDRTGFRFFVTVRNHEGFGPEQIAAGEQAILRALFALGVIKPAAPAPEAKDSAPDDGATSPTQAQQSPPSSAAT
jgi:hypothetical protein